MVPTDDEVIARAEVLLPEIGKRLHATVAHHPLAAGRTLPQIKTMGHLYYCGRCTIGEIATALGVAMPTASELVDRLVEDGLVERGTNPADRRQVIVGLTPVATEFATQIHVLRRAQIRNAIERLEPEERPSFLRALEALAAALRLEPDELGAGDATPASTHP